MKNIIAALLTAGKRINPLVNVSKYITIVTIKISINGQ